MGVCARRLPFDSRTSALALHAFHTFSGFSLPLILLRFFLFLSFICLRSGLGSSLSLLSSLSPLFASLSSYLVSSSHLSSLLHSLFSSHSLSSPSRLSCYSNIPPLLSPRLSLPSLLSSLLPSFLSPPSLFLPLSHSGSEGDFLHPAVPET